MEEDIRISRTFLTWVSAAVVATMVFFCLGFVLYSGQEGRNLRAVDPPASPTAHHPPMPLFPIPIRTFVLDESMPYLPRALHVFCDPTSCSRVGGLHYHPSAPMRLRCNHSWQLFLRCLSTALPKAARCTPPSLFTTFAPVAYTAAAGKRLPGHGLSQVKGGSYCWLPNRDQMSYSAAK
jgi:hypothetical protein